MDTKQHLANVLRWAVGNGSSKTGNPYSKPEIQDALSHLGRLEGLDKVSTDNSWWMNVDLPKVVKGIAGLPRTRQGRSVSHDSTKVSYNWKSHYPRNSKSRGRSNRGSGGKGK